MVKRLRELIREVRTSRTAAEEREMIAKESSEIRNSFANNEDNYRQRNVAKLLYIHMLGYPTKFGQMEPMKLLSSGYYSDKRVGYLGLMLLLDEDTEILMLSTNSIKQDLNHPNPYVVGLALCSLANICNTGMARAVATDVTKLLSSSNPYIRKKAALCAIRIIRKVPDLLEYFVPKIRALLNEKHHGVLITAVTLLIEMCRVEPETVTKVFRPLVSHLVRIMKTLIMTGYVVDYDVGGVTDPFLQVKILHLLRILGKGSPQASEKMNDLLAQVATNTEGSRNVGTAILLECVKTIMSIESESGLRVLAINLLGRFLLNKDNNIRYVALNSLSKFAAKETKAIQGHRQMIVDCLKDPDISIRRRALDLVYLLVNTRNVRVLVRELLNFLLSADLEFRADLTAKICFVTEKFAPSNKWQVDTILRVMAISGDYVSDEVVSNLVNLIVSHEDLQLYAVQKLYLALSKDLMKQPLVQVGVWCIGEFADVLICASPASTDGKNPLPLSVSEADIIQLFNNILIHPATTSTTKDFVITAAMKLTDRIKSATMRQAVDDIIGKFINAVDLELQTRACEYQTLLKKISDEGSIAKLLAKVPPVELYEQDAAVERSAASSASTSTPSATPAAAKPARKQAEAAKTPEPAKPAANPLLEIFGGGAPAATPTATTLAANPLAALAPTTTSTTSTTPAAAANNPLASIFGPSPIAVTPTNTPSPTPAIVPTTTNLTPTPAASGGGGVLMPQNTIHPGMPGAKEPFKAYDQDGVQILFNFRKKPDAPHLTLVNATVKNVGTAPITKFAMLVAVPTFIKMQMDPPSGTNLPAGGHGAIQQIIKLNNTLHGQKPLLLKLKVTFDANGSTIDKVAPPITLSI